MRLFLLVLILMLSGCATLSESECIHGNWYEIGQSDGRWGYKASRIEKHRKACQKVNANVDIDSYMMGRKDGLNYYCTPQNGFDVGLNGSYYNKVCPPQLERDFLEHYSYGQEIYNLRNAISSAEYEIDKKEKQLEDDDLSSEDRKYIRKDIRYLIKEIRQLNRDLSYLENRYNYLF